MGKNEEIVGLIRVKGPVLPVDVAKLLGTDIMIASAHLSEMASKGIVKISNIKVGGSPLYYLPGQEFRLQEYKEKLAEKERQAYELLREKKLLKDSQLPPVVRYAFRQIKDFAKPVEIMGELFWHWYLTPQEEIQGIYKTSYSAKSLERPIPQQPALRANVEESVQSRLSLSAASNRVPPEGERLRKEPVQVVTAHKVTKQTQNIDSGNDIISKAKAYFKEHKIEVIQEQVLKKGKHAWFIVKVPSAIGEIDYYAEVKSKKRITEADLSEAYVRGQGKKLPVLLITDGKPSKIASTEDFFKYISLKQI